MDATGAVLAQVGMCDGCTRPDAGNTALPLGLLPREASMHSVHPRLCCGGGCNLRQWVWSYDHLRVGTFSILCEYLFMFGIAIYHFLLVLHKEIITPVSVRTLCRLPYCLRLFHSCCCAVHDTFSFCFLFGQVCK